MQLPHLKWETRSIHIILSPTYVWFEPSNSMWLMNSFSKNLLGPLRVDVQTHIPLENPFTYQGTAGSWDEQELHQAFVKADVIEVEMPAMNRVSPIFDINSSGTPATEFPHPNETWSLRMTKVGVLNRKDDMMEGGAKSSNRKWKAWSVILTGSQLLFFRDPGWASSFSPISASSVDLISPPSNLFRPDESFSLKDTLAVYDLTYTKVRCLFRMDIFRIS